MKSLITLLEQQVTESETNTTDLGQQRERNHRYWALQPLGNEVYGRSHYIDPSVFESVEDKKAVYSETFLSSRQVVRFSGTNSDEAAAKTAYVQRILKANNYTSLLTDFWHDAFVAKRGTVWVDWKRKREKIQMQLMGHPTSAVNQQLQQLGEITNINKDGLQAFPIPSIGEPQFVYSGTLEVEVDRSYIDLDLIQPEYVYRDPCQAYAHDAAWNGARIDMTRLMLLDWGFDAAQVDRLQYVQMGKSEDNARKSAEGGKTDPAGTDNQETVTIYKTRTWLGPEDFDNKDLEVVFQPEPGAAIYEIYWGNHEVLFWNDGQPAIRVMDTMDVYEWSEYKIAHAANGLCTADVEAHQQKAASGLKRGVMDYMHIVNNPRWEANPEALNDMRDLYDNAIGGVIETADGRPPGNVVPLGVPQLSPVVFGVIQMLDRDSEARKGMSELASGMNMGAVNNQNASDMIERLTNAGMRRVSMGARSFANDFYAPLMQCIVKLAMKYDKSQSVIEAGGKKVLVAPSQWSPDMEMEIEVALTPQEAQAMTIKLLGVDAKLREDPEMKPLYGMKQKHALWDTVYELMGIKDSTKFLASPESPEVQKAFQQMQQQAQQAKARQEKLGGFQSQVLRDQLDLGWAKLNNDIMDTKHDNLLDDKQFEADNVFRGFELQLEKQQKRPVASY
jgi:hypothetical protein